MRINKMGMYENQSGEFVFRYCGLNGYAKYKVKKKLFKSIHKICTAKDVQFPNLSFK